MAASAVQARMPGLSPDRPKILAVDDHPENLVVMESILASTNASVVSVDSGRQALDKMAREDFAVVLLDVMMPGMDGFEVAKQMRNSNANTTPVIFVTAYGRDEVGVLEGYNTGAVDFLCKPINPHVLRTKVQVFLNLNHAQQDQMRINQRLASMQDDLIGRQLEARFSMEMMNRQKRKLQMRCHELVRRQKSQAGAVVDNRPPLQAILDYLDLIEASRGDSASQEERQWIQSCRKLARTCMA